MVRRDLIAEKLTKAFAPASLDVVDESDRHTGHAGHRGGGETHFRVDSNSGIRAPAMYLRCRDKLPLVRPNGPPETIRV
jgi:hypothetical protein